MADPKNTAPNDPGASSVHAMTEGAGPLGLADAIDQRLTAAAAIVDLARVLAA